MAGVVLACVVMVMAYTVMARRRWSDKLVFQAFMGMGAGAHSHGHTDVHSGMAQRHCTARHGAARHGTARTCHARRVRLFEDDEPELRCRGFRGWDVVMAYVVMAYI